MSTKQYSKYNRAFRFYDSSVGHLVLMMIVWVVGYSFFWVAVDTGSTLQWLLVIFSLFYGIYHLVQAIRLFVKKLWHKTNSKA